MKFKSQVLTEASGSVGGITYSHNRGGMYQRARAIPVNPNTVYQQAVKSAMSALTSHWLNTLTPAERVAWDLYAEMVPLPDALGEPRNVGGLGMYVRSNVPRIQAGEPRQDTAPGVFNLGEYTDPVIGAIAAAAGTLSLAFTNTDDWASEDDSAMLVHVSRGVNPSINFFKGPYRYADRVMGDSVAPPVSPQVINLPFAVIVGQRVFAKITVTRADGRYSATFRGFGTAA